MDKRHKEILSKFEYFHQIFNNFCRNGKLALMTASIFAIIFKKMEEVKKIKFPIKINSSKNINIEKMVVKYDIAEIYKFIEYSIHEVYSKGLNMDLNQSFILKKNLDDLKMLLVKEIKK